MSRGLAAICLLWSTVGGRPIDAGEAHAGAPVPDAGSAGQSEVSVPEGRVATLTIQAGAGDALERRPEFVASVPSYGRAVQMDSDQRWPEAAGLYQQALTEIGSAARFPNGLPIESAVFKIDLERRRSRELVEGPTVRPVRPPPPPPPPGMRSTGAMTPRMSALERARLLRLKLMAVRTATGAVPAGLFSATLGELGRALREVAAAGPRGSKDHQEHRPAGGDPEVRLLMCATRAAAGDRIGARLELAHVRPSDRSHPTRALALAVCQAALGYKDDALASLAVGVDRLGPGSRFLPTQSREIESSNDWDALRSDPRFAPIFR